MRYEQLVKEQRQSNVELLRIIAMLMIIAHHFSIHGGFETIPNIPPFNSLWIHFILIGGKIGVDIFILISGYFMVSNIKSVTSKAIKIWLQLFFYSIIIFIFSVVFLGGELNKYTLIHAIFPAYNNKWWFASIYFVLLLISPFLNILFNSLNKQKYQLLIVLLFVIWSFIPTLSTKELASSYLLWFIFLYATGGYLKLHLAKQKKSGFFYIGLGCILIVVTFIASAILKSLGTRFPLFALYSNILYEMQSVPILIISILMLLGFLNMNIKSNRFINTIASSTFGIYLIHDHEVIRNLLWKNIFHVTDYSNRKIFIPYSIFVIVIVFISCSAIELLRQFIFEKNYTKYVNNIAGKIDFKIHKMLSGKLFQKF